MNRGPHRHARAGYTLLDLVVVTAGVVLLAGVLLPAIGQVARRARRTQCQSNLHHIGRALANYHDTHQCLPPGWTRGADEPWPWQATTMWTQLLAYVNATWCENLNATWRQRPYDQDRGLSDYPGGPNSTLALGVLTQFLCPSDRPVYYSRDTQRGEASYVGNWGIQSKERDRRPGDRFATGDYGPFSANSCVRFQDLRDGAAQTFAVGETAFGNGGGAARWAFGWGGYCLSGTRHALNPRGLPGPDTQGAFSSAHEGGAFFLFCDGHVRFVSEGVDLSTYRALSTYAGGESAENRR